MAVRRRDLEGLEHGLGLGLLPAEPGEPWLSALAQVRQGDVLLDGEVGRQALAVAVLRDVGDAGAQRLPDAGTFEGELGSVDHDRAAATQRTRRERREARQTRVDAAGEAHDLAAPHGGGDPSDSPATDLTKLDPAVADLGGHALGEVVELAVPTEHQLGQGCLVEVCRRQSHLDDSAVAQGGDPVGDLQHFPEVVAHDHDAGSLGGQQVDHVVEVAERFMRDGPRRLVEDDDAAADAALLQRPRDRDADALARTQACHLGLGRDVAEVQELQRLAHGFCVLALVDPAREAGRRVTTDSHVLAHGEVGDQPEVLVDEGEAFIVQPARVDRRADALPVDEDLAAMVGTVDTADELDQRGLARPVLPDERVDLTRPNLEVGVLQHGHSSERLRQGADFKPRCGHLRNTSSCSSNRSRHRERDSYWTCLALT